MTDNELSQWTEEEGIYHASGFQLFLRKLGFSYRVGFIPKHMLKEISEYSSEEFEKTWEQLKQQGAVRKVLVKYDKGKIIEVMDPDFPEFKMIYWKGAYKNDRNPFW